MIWLVRVVRVFSGDSGLLALFRLTISTAGLVGRQYEQSFKVLFMNPVKTEILSKLFYGMKTDSYVLIIPSCVFAR